MRIMFGTQDKIHCIRVPLRLVYSRLGVRLLTNAVSSQTEGDTSLPLMTQPQATALLKALRQGSDVLAQSQLPLVDVQRKDGFFLRIEC